MPDSKNWPLCSGFLPLDFVSSLLPDFHLLEAVLGLTREWGSLNGGRVCNNIRPEGVAYLRCHVQSSTTLGTEEKSLSRLDLFR